MMILILCVYQLQFENITRIIIFFKSQLSITFLLTFPSKINIINIGITKDSILRVLFLKIKHCHKNTLMSNYLLFVRYDPSLSADLRKKEIK